MIRRLLLLLTFLLILPAYSGEYEDAINSGSPVFLYLYTQECGYCRKFNPIYDRLTRGDYKDTYKFLKINANTESGRNLMFAFRANYVPFVVLINHKQQKMYGITPSCLLNLLCTEKELKKFLK